MYRYFISNEKIVGLIIKIYLDVKIKRCRKLLRARGVQFLIERHIVLKEGTNKNQKALSCLLVNAITHKEINVQTQRISS